MKVAIYTECLLSAKKKKKHAHSISTDIHPYIGECAVILGGAGGRLITDGKKNKTLGQYPGSYFLCAPCMGNNYKKPNP